MRIGFGKIGFEVVGGLGWGVTVMNVAPMSALITNKENHRRANETEEFALKCLSTKLLFRGMGHFLSGQASRVGLSLERQKPKLPKPAQAKFSLNRN